MALKDYTEAELNSLAPEERAALEAEDAGNEDTIRQIAEGGEQGAAVAPAADGAAAAPAATPAPTAAPAPAGEGAAAPAATPAPTAAPAAAAASEPPPAPQPVTYRAEVGEIAKDIQAQKESIATARAEKRDALKKLNDGEIDFEEYSKVETSADEKIDAAQDKILELNRSATRAEVATELTQQQQIGAWRGMVQTYVKGAKDADGIDYSGDAGKPMREELGRLTKAFAVEAEERGLSDDNNMEASRWALDQAAALMRVRHPKAGAAPAATPAPAAAATPAATPAPAAARHGVTTLGAMPAAAAAPIADDVMAKIGTLEGDELERYLASLPPAEYARVTSAAQ